MIKSPGRPFVPGLTFPLQEVNGKRNDFIKIHKKDETASHPHLAFMNVMRLLF